MSDKTGKAPDVGPLDRQLAANLVRLRQDRGLSTTGLAAKLDELGHAIPATAITRIEKCQRRVPATDLVALALALNVSPLTLLFPPHANDEQVGLTPKKALSSRTVWAWGTGERTASDWMPGAGVALAGSGADPAISAESYQAEQEFGRDQAAFQALTEPEEYRHASAHPAVRIAQNLTSVIRDLVSPEYYPVEQKALIQATLSRMARRRYAQLGYELDEIEERLPKGVNPVPLPGDDEDR